MSAEKKPTDWESIERQYRAGVLSIREIGKAHDVSDTAIRKKAKTADWQRDLSAKVAEKVRIDLVRSEVRTANPQTEREIVEEAAATVVHVVRSHRTRIKNGSALVELLTGQLLDAASNRDELEESIEDECKGDLDSRRRNAMLRAVSLASHSAIAVNLANATKTWVGLERQAFGLDDKGGSDAPTSQDQVDDELAVLLGKARNGGH